jgi:ABC-type transport system substrate-binding protein
MRLSSRIAGGFMVIAAMLAIVLTPVVSAQTRPAGELVWAWHVTIAPSWFDPGEVPAQVTPFNLIYALHDAVVRSMPGERMGNSLAESWTESPDGLVYEFKLRQGLRFHNGDPCTAEDVKFTFERYKGAGARELKDKVKQVDIVDPLTVRFHLHEPWPDFMTFYGTMVAGHGWIVHAAEPRDRPQEARGAAEADPADAGRARPVRDDLRLRLAERSRLPGGRSGLPQDRPLSVVGAVRRPSSEEIAGPWRSIASGR